MVLKNKRGAEYGFTTIAVLIVIVIVIVLVVFFFAGFFNRVDEVSSTVPQSVQARAIICEGLVSANGFVDYCTNFNTRDSDDNFYSCQSSLIEKELRLKGIEPLNCSSYGDEIKAKKLEICNEVDDGDKDDVEVDGVTCTKILGASKTCTELGGSWVTDPDDDSCGSLGAEDLTSNVGDDSDKPEGTTVLCCSS